MTFNIKIIKQDLLMKVPRILRSRTVSIQHSIKNENGYEIPRD